MHMYKQMRVQPICSLTGVDSTGGFRSLCLQGMMTEGVRRGLILLNS